MLVIEILNCEGLDLSLSKSLSEGDEIRFGNYLRDDTKKLFLGGRILISRLADGKPLSFQENKKPYIDGGIPFSLSHSYPYAVLAYSDRPVGVDIESRSRSNVGFLDTFFDEDEKELFDGNLPLWCLKEASYKCLGEGRFDPKKRITKIDESRLEYLGHTLYYRLIEREDFIIALVSEANEEPEIRDAK